MSKSLESKPEKVHIRAILMGEIFFGGTWTMIGIGFNLW
jgi:hypothetical protein